MDYISFSNTVYQLDNTNDGAHVCFEVHGDCDLAARFVLKDKTIPNGSVVTLYNHNKSVSQRYRPLSVFFQLKNPTQARTISPSRNGP